MWYEIYQNKQTKEFRFVFTPSAAWDLSPKFWDKFTQRQYDEYIEAQKAQPARAEAEE